MSPDQQRISIAEACGWRKDPRGGNTACWHKPGHTLPGGRDFISKMGLPDYLNDLNAMHEAEKVLDKNGHVLFIRALYFVLFGNDEKEDETDESAMFYMAHATAAQRAEAFLRTLNLWTE